MTHAILELADRDSDAVVRFMALMLDDCDLTNTQEIVCVLQRARYTAAQITAHMDEAVLQALLNRFIANAIERRVS